MCEFHGSNGNGLGDIWWTDKSFYFSIILGGCPFNGLWPLSGMKYPTRESPRRAAASPIKYNGLRVRPAAVSNLLSSIVI